MSYIGDVGRLDSTINSDFSKYTYEYIATEGQTVFTGTDINSATLGYTAGNVLLTYGGLDIPQSDYTATDGVSIVLTDPAIAGEIVRVIAFQAFEVADAYTKIQADDLLATKAPLASPSFTGNVGIGTNSPTKKVEIAGNNHALASNTTLRFTDTDTATQTDQHFGKIEFNSLDASAVSPDRAYITAASENSLAGSYISFGTSAFTAAVSEKLRIDGAGNLLVGKTVSSGTNVGCEFRADGLGIFTGDGRNPVQVRRLTNDGSLIDFLRDTTAVGSIGSVIGAYIQIYSTGANGCGLTFGNGSIVPVNSSGGGSDNFVDFGNISNRFDDIYATNPNIITSDRNEKQDILEITTAEHAVAKSCKGLLRSFRWKSAVAKKGDDARIHFGIIAQDLQSAFTAEGLDAGRYAMFVSSTWWETQTEVPAVEAVDEVTDEDGNITTEAVEAKDAYTRTDTFETLAEAPAGATERTRLGVRYSELLAFIIAAL